MQVLVTLWVFGDFLLYRKSTYKDNYSMVRLRFHVKSKHLKRFIKVHSKKVNVLPPHTV